MQELIEKMTGWKATDANMKCKDVQFVLGEWQECEGNLVECQNGFHFCEYPSGPWAYYSGPGTRIWRVEAEQVLAKKRDPGADLKRVARRIRLVEEVLIGGDQNTGHSNTGHRNTGNWNTGHSNTGHSNTGNWNTGDRNTGDRNTGNWNTGDSNTGNWNTGDRNTGDRNTGNWNTGDRNTGDRNTGHSNTGHSNTGNWNTGDRNTGDRNTGNWNTGDRNTGDSNTGNWNTGHRNTGNWNTGDSNTGNWNATDRSSGLFCVEPQLVKSFDIQTELTYEQFLARYPESHALGRLLMESEPIPFEPYKNIPGITPEKLLALHAKHLEALK